MKRLNKKGGAREYIISAVLVGLFIVALLQFANFSAVDNGGRNILSDPVLNNSMGNMSVALGGFVGDTGTQLNSTNTEQPQSSFGSLVLLSVLNAGRVFTGTVTGVYSIIGYLLVQKLGMPPFVISVISGIIIVSLIFFLWRMYRLGT